MKNNLTGNTTITKLSQETFMIQYLDGFVVMGWGAVLEFYIETLEIEQENIIQTMESLSFMKIGETEEA